MDSSEQKQIEYEKLKKALKEMPKGSVWEVYIPQELAYGEREQAKIKPFSTLIFKIELIDVENLPSTISIK